MGNERLSRPDSCEAGQGSGSPPVLAGLCHVRFPVADPWRSRDWYANVLGFVPLLDVEVETGLVGVVLQHRCGLVLGLHHDPVRATALSGFALVGLAVDGRQALTCWTEALDEQGVSHGPVEEGHLGWYFDVPDPDGIAVRIHVGLPPYAEEG